MISLEHPNRKLIKNLLRDRCTQSSPIFLGLPKFICRAKNTEIANSPLYAKHIPKLEGLSQANAAKTASKTSRKKREERKSHLHPCLSKISHGYQN
jgi:hypothetical protein